MPAASGWSGQIEMAQRLQRLNIKTREGAFFQTDGSDKNLILRRCQFSDGAEPSGNAVHADNLIRLYQLTQREDYLDQAEDIFKAVKDYLENYPPGYCYHVMSLQRYFDQNAPTIVVALNSKRDHENEIKKGLYQNFIPHKAVIWQTQDVELEELIPFVKGHIAKGDETTLYICREGVCLEPIDQLPEILEAIEQL